MKSFKGLRALAICLAFVSAQAVHADVTLSQSNNPKLALGAELTALFAQEHSAMETVDTSAVSRVLAQYKPKPKPTPPVQISYTREYLDSLPEANGGEDFKCLSEALYFEARGESVQGQFAVAEVILNRVSSPAFPSSVCSVVNQGTGALHRCQFSYTCDGRAEAIHEEGAFERVAKVARMMLDGAPRRLTSGATHYHTNAVSPRWAQKFARTAQIGVHFFYRMPQA
ncbi:cell wall hydrolase [Celeribacter arenosi]|uniref:Cell wall hydrolase n=1 Tax=Celeribacter arenosi TaxID=792649 RepID=A0ABP7K9U3_9RHOB